MASSGAVDGRQAGPVLLGITGHRELRDEDREALSRAVRALIEEVRSAAPTATIVVMSSLAEGADQLAAEVALAAGARLWVPLPFDPRVYRQGLAEAAAARFDGLLSRADVVVPLALARGSTRAGVARPGPQRDVQYALAGAWILRRCQVLIALWDGHGPPEIGGTACTVAWRLAGLQDSFATEHPLRAALDGAERGPVWQVVTPRAKSRAQLPRPGTIIRKYPDAPDDDARSAEELRQTFR